MDIREAAKGDLPTLLGLYAELKGEVITDDERISGIWDAILADPNHHVLLGCINGVPVSSLVMVIVPNLTHDAHPYALVENVVTASAHRGRGYATAMLDHAHGLAVKAGCYKIMLMTGSKREQTLSFYDRAGYNRQDKTAFIQWL